MFNSLRVRLFLSHLLVVAVSVLFIGLALFLLARSSPAIERIDYLRLNEIARAARRDPPAATDPLALAEYARRLAADHEVRVLFVNRTGAVEIDSDSPDGRPTAGITQVQPLAGNPDRDRGLLRDSNGRTWAFLIAPGVLPSGLRLVLLDQRTGPLQFLLNNFLAPLFQTACLGTATSVAMALLIAYWLTSSLRRFSEAASAVAKGDLDHTVPTTGPAEVQSLARSFNDMVARVKTSQLAQRDFVANVSHELKTPLTSIQGFSQAILDGAEQNPAHAARIINDEASRMRRLVDGLLDLARLDAGQAALQRGPTDLGAILHSTIEKLTLRANEKDVTLRADIQPLPSVVADGDRLAPVFANLLDNALKHTPSGGTVTLSATAAAGAVTVAVADTGAGIPANDLSRIFERFYRVDKSRAAGQGYGIGLAISKEIVQAHGGAISAESVVGLGTKFTVRLPVAQSGDTTVAKRRAK
jgi:signal transduction histidine kinase